MLPAWELFNHERAGASSLPALSFFHSFYSSGFFIGVFCHADFANDADFFIHRMTRNLFGGFLLRRLLTDWRGGDLCGRYRYPLRVEYVPQISQMYTDFSGEGFLTQISQMTQIFYLIKICEICGTKKVQRRKICVIREICVTKNNSSTYRAPAIGQRPNIRGNP